MLRVPIVVAAIYFLVSCSSPKNENFTHVSFDSAYKIEEGFEMQLVAAEPLIVAPVAIDFDNSGRIWVVEMRGYMPDVNGNGEDRPTGRISILDDFDNHGVGRRSTVFLDSLVLPRALALVYGGLLYAEPPNLWFVEINDNKPGKRTLVDSLYANGGYVELQPNGLMMNIDNWIYSANSSSRYQMRDGKWFREPTTFRGQWGIGKDNFGRMYYNYNEAQLAGDNVLPNLVINNPYFIPRESENRLLTDDQRVYPLHPTTVNRGYQEGILTADSLLKKFTAACGPVVYRGNQFPDNYSQNVFVCEPQANLIKRNILLFDSLGTTARQAWEKKEFVASTDEGFRPVTLTNAPDGSLYVVDMHRGVLEHRAVASPYYRSEIEEKQLDTLLSWGRIIRIKNKNKSPDKFPDFVNAGTSQLVQMLRSDNGWIRDRAQQLIVQKHDTGVIDALQKIAQDKNEVVPAIHALHTLNGLNGLGFDFLENVLPNAHADVVAHSLVLLQQYASKENTERYKMVVERLLEQNHMQIDYYLAATMGPWIKVSAEPFVNLLARLSDKHSGNLVFQEAVTSSAAGYEERLVSSRGTNEILDSLIATAAANKKENRPNTIFATRKLPRDERANGMVLFRKTCSGCHGNDGEGIEHVGPPLRESQYVQGSVDRLAMIILAGLEGPIHINDKEYRFNGAMPNFANNFSDDEIADIVRFLRNSYTSSRKSIDANRVKELRKKVSGTLTEQELLKMD